MTTKQPQAATFFGEPMVEGWSWLHLTTKRGSTNILCDLAQTYSGMPQQWRASCDTPVRATIYDSDPHSALRQLEAAVLQKVRDFAAFADIDLEDDES